jgi:hypothetical protein
VSPAQSAPFGHNSHGAPVRFATGSYIPDWHTHWSSDNPESRVAPCASVSSPARCAVPAGHSWHVTAPVTSAYFVPPWYEHGTHAICPLRELDVPTGQATHALAVPDSRADPGAQGSHRPKTVEASMVVLAVSSRTYPPSHDTAHAASVASYALPLGHVCAKARARRCTWRSWPASPNAARSPVARAVAADARSATASSEGTTMPRRRRRVSIRALPHRSAAGARTTALRDASRAQVFSTVSTRIRGLPVGPKAFPSFRAAPVRYPPVG